jgi:vacuolar-type H+-ATPase subunit H
MKKAHLPNGQTLVFPENTSQKVIEDTVKRISSSKKDVEWTSDHVNSVIREMTAAQGKIDLEKSQIDHFGPAINEQTKNIEKLNTSFSQSFQKFLSEFIKSDKKKSDDVVNSVKPVIQEISKQIVNLSNKHEMISLKKDNGLFNFLDKLSISLDLNTKAVNDLKAAQIENNRVMRDLVEATKSTKKIIRNKNGDVIGVETE